MDAVQTEKEPLRLNEVVFSGITLDMDNQQTNVNEMSSKSEMVGKDESSKLSDKISNIPQKEDGAPKKNKIAKNSRKSEQKNTENKNVVEKLPDNQNKALENTKVNEKFGNSSVKNLKRKSKTVENKIPKKRHTKDGSPVKSKVNKSNKMSDVDRSQKTEKQRRKIPSHPPTSQMVLESLQHLKPRKGVSSNAIRSYIEGHYIVNMNRIKPHLNRFLIKGAETGVLEQISGVGATGRFKIKAKAPGKNKRNLDR